MNIRKNSNFIVEYNNMQHLVSENYSYKTEAYYSILQHELNNTPINPSSDVILEAYVIPLCLEKAKLHKIPVCEWGISQGYVPVPSIIYGLNYFSDSSEFSVVTNQNKTKEIVDHVTNMGKYPLCFQEIDANSIVRSCIGIFGESLNVPTAVSELMKKVYKIFPIPLMKMTYVKSKNYSLSSLGPVAYSALSKDEKKLLKIYIIEAV
jgi:hypothetical protein